MTWRRWTGLALLTVCLAVMLVGCQGGQWSVDGGSNYETTQVGAMYSPDPNGGFGVRMMTDSVIPDDTDQNIAVGPQVAFNLGDVAAAAADRVIPGEWQPLAGAPVALYGTMALLWETDSRDMIFLPGTELRFTSNKRAQPFVRVERMTPEGSADVDDDVLTTFGARYNF